MFKCKSMIIIIRNHYIYIIIMLIVINIITISMHVGIVALC